MLLCECPHRCHPDPHDPKQAIAKTAAHTYAAAIPTQMAFELREQADVDNVQIAVCAACAHQRH